MPPARRDGRVRRLVDAVIRSAFERQKTYLAVGAMCRMVPLLIPGGPELVIVAMVLVIPLALLYVAYKLFRGWQAFREGQRRTERDRR